MVEQGYLKEREADINRPPNFIVGWLSVAVVVRLGSGTAYIGCEVIWFLRFHKLYELVQLVSYRKLVRCIYKIISTMYMFSVCCLAFVQAGGCTPL